MEKINRELNAIFSVSEEMVRNNGEDCFYFDAPDDTFIISVFDGCGGSGSKKYANYTGKTGAYMASRAICGGVRTWFYESNEENKLHEYVNESLAVCKRYGEKSGRIMGSLGKDFPTTAAITVGKIYKGNIHITCYWAGDSRCYMLDAMGLHQLTADDLDSQDAMSNLTDDGVMTNVINASTSFVIHSKNLIVDHPCIFLTATDGCFGYLNSPMEFEYLLISSLVEANNLFEWKQKLNEKMQEVTGDDYTLTVAVYGFKDNFRSVQKEFMQRSTYMKSEYISSERNPLKAWNQYKKDYEIYLE